MSALLLK